MVGPQLRGWLLAVAALAPLGAGCAGTLDTITSQRFRHNPFKALFHSDDPMEVLRKSQEADERRRAMLEVKEPARSGKAAGEQDELMQILSSSATGDRQALCRLGAIEALTRFEDPRSAQILMTAYQNANTDAPGDQPRPPADGIVQAGRRTTATVPVSAFTPEQSAMIQIAAIEGLGKKRSPEGLNLICELAAAPAKKPEVKKTEIEVLLAGGGNDAQDVYDLRLPAIRALANYKGDPRAAATLYKIMTTERSNVAAKNRAYLSLKEVTGKKLPPDSPEWAAIVGISPAPSAGPTPPPKK